jgi:hypothetical protein
VRELFVGWFDYYAARTEERLAGLTDAEYLWEPVANCWSVRRRDEFIHHTAEIGLLRDLYANRQP